MPLHPPLSGEFYAGVLPRFNPQGFATDVYPLLLAVEMIAVPTCARGDRGWLPRKHGGIRMLHNRALAQNPAFDLARRLLVPVKLIEVDGEFGVLASAAVELIAIREYDRWDPALRSAVRCRWRCVGRKGSFAAAMGLWCAVSHSALAFATLRG